jgi:hypothetical protein
MRLIINSPTNIATGKPSGRSWKAGLLSNQTNKVQETEHMENNGTFKLKANGVIPMSALGFDELRKANNQPTILSDGSIRPMSALGFNLNADEIGSQALWNRLQAQLDTLEQDEHSFIMLKEVFDSYFVYEINNKLYKRSFSLDENNQVELADDAKEVMEEVQYEPINSVRTQAASEVQPMSALGF